MTITEFLTARYDEDEAAARAANAASAAYGQGDDAFDEAVCLAANEGGLPEAVNHMRRWGPEFVLADTAAKKAIVQAWITADEMAGPYPGTDAGHEMGLHQALILLAQPYTAHPDFDESWKP